MSAPTRSSRSPRRTPPFADDRGKQVVLILSSDVIAAALIGAFVETLGYLVRFSHPEESPEAAMRRARPTVTMVDCDDPTVMSDETIGRARMRGTSVVVFGTSEGLGRVRPLALDHELETLEMPASLDALDAALRKGVAD